MKENLSTKQDKAIDLLLVHFSVARVAQELSIAPSTLWRWQQEPLFQQRYRIARRAVTERSGALLQQASQLAAQRLVQMINDDDVPISIQFAACCKVLEFAHRAEELTDLQASVEELRAMLSDSSPPASKKGLRAV